MNINQKIYLVCGETGAGKSTFVRTMSNLGFPTFHSGAVFKRISKFSDIKKTDDMESPEFADAEIEASMYRFLGTFADEEAVFLETIPRSIGSLEWVKMLVMQYGRKNVYALWFHADQEERRERMMKRDRDSGRSYFDMERMKSEDKTKHATLVYGLNMILGNNFHFVDGMQPCMKTFNDVVGIDIPNSINGLYNSAVNGYFERSGYCGKKADFNRMIQRIRFEIDELVEEHDKTNPDQHKIELEFADVMHFFFCLANACGLSPKNMIDIFIEKTKINQARLQFNVSDERKHYLTGNLIGDDIYAKRPIC